MPSHAVLWIVPPPLTPPPPIKSLRFPHKSMSLELGPDSNLSLISTILLPKFGHIYFILKIDSSAYRDRFSRTPVYLYQQDILRKYHFYCDILFILNLIIRDALSGRLADSPPAPLE